MTAGAGLRHVLTTALHALLLSAAVVATAGAAGLSAEREDELGRLLRHDCGSCHGLTLNGGLGPPLTPEALAARPLATLAAVIRDGIPGTAMPPWRQLLSDADIAYLVTLLRRGGGR